MEPAVQSLDHNPKVFRNSIESSNIISVGYDPDLCLLDVEYKSNSGKKGFYRYYDVPNFIWEGRKMFKSLGSYLAENVKNQYKHEFISEKDENNT